MVDRFLDAQGDFPGRDRQEFVMEVAEPGPLVAAMSAAIESYKADNGIYPRGPATNTTIGTITIPANVTDTLDAKTYGNPTSKMVEPVDPVCEGNE